MARSVVLKGVARCERCQLPHRWCICAVQHPLPCPILADVLQHEKESYRPSSTGNLLARVAQGVRLHRFRPEESLRRESIVRPEAAELWILHPQGEPPPASSPPPERLQVLLLDASWAQAAGMLDAVQAWGRCIRLPMTGPGRFALRSSGGPGRHSTFEALLFILETLGLNDTAAPLRAQFELHVYAGLLARGRKTQAAAYLATSPAANAFPEMIAELARRRPASPSP